MKKITKLLTPNEFSRPGLKIKEVRGIVVHWVANTNTSAEANRRFFENRKNGKTRYGSAHYIIDLNGDIIQCIPDNEIAYHVGAKSYKSVVKEKLFNNPNFYTLGIECTHIKGSGEMSLDTYNSLIQLTLELCKRYKVNPSTFLFRHFDITGKMCHKWFVDNPSEWEQFKNKINNVKKIEYKMIVGSSVENMLNDEGMLNDYGSEGWELVSVIYPVKPKDRGIGAKAALYYLKREV